MILAEGIKLPNNYQILRNACKGYKVDNVDVIDSVLRLFAWHQKFDMVKEPEYYFEKLSEVNKGQFIEFNLKEMFCALVYCRIGQFWDLGQNKDDATDIKQGYILRRIKEDNEQEQLLCLLGCNTDIDIPGIFCKEEDNTLYSLTISKGVYEVLKPVRL